MATHRFTTTIVVAGTRYEAGYEVDPSEIPPGNFDSLVRQGQLVAVPPDEIARRVQRNAERELRQAPLGFEESNPAEAPKVDPGDDPDATPAEKAKATATAAPPKKK